MMSERVTISYRGAAYELGRGKRCYAVWAVEAPRSEPVERWPETPDGWGAAWTRFTALETPGTIGPVGQARQNASSADVIDAGAEGGSVRVKSLPVAVGLLTAGIILGVVGLFPGYLSGASLASSPPNLVTHVAYIAAWTISAVLIALGGGRRQAGALLGLGTSVVTFGLFCVDLAMLATSHPHTSGAGLWLSVAGWLACAAGSEIAFRLRPAGMLSIPRGYDVARVVVLVVAGIGAAIAFAPAWDSYLLRTTTGQSESITAGNAFSSPSWVIAGNIAVMVLFAAVIVVAALWRPTRLGSMLMLGGLIPMAAQAVSGLVQASEATSPTVFGITPAQASQVGLTITNGLTPAFWIFSLFVVVLVVSCLWLLVTPPVPAAPAGEPAVAAPALADPYLGEQVHPVPQAADVPVPQEADVLRAPDVPVSTVAMPATPAGELWDTEELSTSDASPKDD
jgi:hypothetical protein